jgi:hypothetical protein
MTDYSTFPESIYGTLQRQDAEFEAKVLENQHLRCPLCGHEPHECGCASGCVCECDCEETGPCCGCDCECSFCIAKREAELNGDDSRLEALDAAHVRALDAARYDAEFLCYD